MRLARIPITMAVALLAAVTFVVIAPTAGATPYPGGCTIQISQVRATPGQQLTVTASGYPAGAQVTFTLSRPGEGTPPPQSDNGPVVLGTVTANASGVATLVFTLPAGTKPGMHVITASGSPPGDCDPLVSTNLMVDAANVGTTIPATSGTGTLPRTGTNSAELLQLALVLIAVGGIITLATRKRRQRAGVDS
jgi:LPXTG-motif cell wall-anchored protein